MKPTSKYERQRTFIEMLQSRIDVRSTDITRYEWYDEYNGGYYKDLERLRAEQVWDKRLLGYIIDLHRHLRICHAAASVKWKEDYEAKVVASKVKDSWETL